MVFMNSLTNNNENNNKIESIRVDIRVGGKSELQQPKIEDHESILSPPIFLLIAHQTFPSKYFYLLLLFLS